LAVALAALGFALVGNFVYQMLVAGPIVDRHLACEPSLLVDANAGLVTDQAAVDRCIEDSRAAFDDEGVSFLTKNVHQRARLFFNTVGLAALALAWITPFVGRRHRLNRWSLGAASILTVLTLVALVSQLWYGDTIAVLTEVHH
jgi:hypothetical protein